MIIVAKLKDYPSLVTCALVGVVVAHWLAASRFDRVPNPVEELVDRSATSALYLGTAGVVAIAAGFAGVVIVFAMSRDNETFAKLRRKGGARLQSNWLALLTSPTLAAWCLLSAACLEELGNPVLAGWVFEFALLAAAHGSVRLVWLFRKLLDAVEAEDRRDAKAESPAVSLRELQRKV